LDARWKVDTVSWVGDQRANCIIAHKHNSLDMMEECPVQVHFYTERKMWCTLQSLQKPAGEIKGKKRLRLQMRQQRKNALIENAPQTMEHGGRNEECFLIKKKRIQEKVI